MVRSGGAPSNRGSQPSTSSSDPFDPIIPREPYIDPDESKTTTSENSSSTQNETIVVSVFFNVNNNQKKKKKCINKLLLIKHTISSKTQCFSGHHENKNGHNDENVDLHI